LSQTCIAFNPQGHPLHEFVSDTSPGHSRNRPLRLLSLYPCNDRLGRRPGTHRQSLPEANFAVGRCRRVARNMLTFSGVTGDPLDVTAVERALCDRKNDSCAQITKNGTGHSRRLARRLASIQRRRWRCMQLAFHPPPNPLKRISATLGRDGERHSLSHNGYEIGRQRAHLETLPDAHAAC
jgi:hypothetical protein